MTQLNLNVERDVEPNKPPRRDWVALMGPTAFAVAVTILLQAGGYVWFISALSERVAGMELRQQDVARTLQRLPTDYVPRLELTHAEDLTQLEQTEQLRRMDRIETKVDVLLQQHGVPQDR